MKNDFDFNEWFKNLSKGDGLRKDFKRTGIRGLDEAIHKCMEINDEMQKIGT